MAFAALSVSNTDSCPATAPVVASPRLPTRRVLADGTKMHYGSVNARVQYQMSGILEEGVREDITIPNGFTIRLGPAGTNRDGERQRNEFLSTEHGQAGEIWLYKWLYYMEGPVGFGYQFFHICQLLTREKGHGPFVFALSLAGGKFHIKTTLDNHPRELPFIPADKFHNRLTSHRCKVKYGAHGSIHYSVTDAATNELLLLFEVNDEYIPVNSSMKQGLYRAAVFGPATAYVGGFDFTKRDK